jgi:predicted transcriptional regulator YheO
MPASPKKHRGMDRAAGADGDDLTVRNVTGKELSQVEELSARLTTLVEMLDEKGILNKKEYHRTVAMRLHEISKAGAIEELDEEL